MDYSAPILRGTNAPRAPRAQAFWDHAYFFCQPSARARPNRNVWMRNRRRQEGPCVNARFLRGGPMTLLLRGTTGSCRH